MLAKIVLKNLRIKKGLIIWFLVWIFCAENRDEDEESLSSESMKSSSFRFLPNSKPDLSTGFHRLCKSFKNFSQLFGKPRT